MQVLVSPDGAWKVEQLDDQWCRLTHNGQVIYKRAAVHVVARYLMAVGVDIEDLKPQ